MKPATIASSIIRVILSILLLKAVYSETGVWTTVAFALIWVSNELNALVFRGINKLIAELKTNHIFY